MASIDPVIEVRFDDKQIHELRQIAADIKTEREHCSRILRVMRRVEAWFIKRFPHGS